MAGPNIGTSYDLVTDTLGGDIRNDDNTFVFLLSALQCPSLKAHSNTCCGLKTTKLHVCTGTELTLELKVHDKQHGTETGKPPSNPTHLYFTGCPLSSLFSALITINTCWNCDLMFLAQNG